MGGEMKIFFKEVEELGEKEKMEWEGVSREGREEKGQEKNKILNVW